MIFMNWIEKISRFLNIEKGFLSVSVGNVIASVSGALFWLFVASVLIAEDYGKLNYYLSISLLFSVVSLLGTNTTVITFLAKKDEDIKYQANFLVLISSVGASIIIFIFTNNYIISLLLVGMSFFTLTWAEALGRRQYKKYSILLITQRVAQIALSISLYFILGLDGLLLGYAVAALLFSFNFFRSFHGFRFRFRKLRTRIPFMMHSYSLALSQAATMYFDKLLIGPLFGFAVLGYYQIGFQFLMILSLLPVSVFHFLLPSEAARAPSKDITKKMIVAAIILSVLSFLSVPHLINFFFPQFSDGILAAQIMAFGLIPMTINSLLNSKLLGSERSKGVFFGAIVYIILLTLLVIVLGTSFELIGLAFSVVFALIGQSVALLITLKLAVFSGESKPSQNHNSKSF